jgi:hypothetical protein
MEDNKENTIKRFYTGFRAIKNAILSHCKDGQTVDLTAVEIATAGNFNPKSVRISAKRLGVRLKADKRGGARTPSNQHTKKSGSLDEASSSKPAV